MMKKERKTEILKLERKEMKKEKERQKTFPRFFAACHNAMIRSLTIWVWGLPFFLVWEK